MNLDRVTRNWAAVGIVAILMACSGGCYDEGDSITEDSATDPGGEEVFAADTSKIYFQSGSLDQTYTMNSDGTGKAALPEGAWGEPSVALHGGNRWFVRRMSLYPETYPDGQPRRELFAFRGDGNSAFTVQLTSQADLQVMPINRWVGGESLRWKPGDAGISWIARRWSGGSVVEGGIYSADIVFDADGNVTGLFAQPSSPAVAVALVNGNPQLVEFDWSPDGSQVVHNRGGNLHVANLSGSSQVLVQGGVYVPRWSPSGSKIAYASGQDFRIYMISPDGSGGKAVTSPGNKFDWGPIWSPTGTHFLFGRGTSLAPGGVSDIYRAAVGSPKITNLTADFANASAFGWR